MRRCLPPVPGKWRPYGACWQNYQPYPAPSLYELPNYLYVVNCVRYADGACPTACRNQREKCATS